MDSPSDNAPANVPYAAVANLFEQAHSPGVEPRKLSAGGHIAAGVDAATVANSNHHVITFEPAWKNDAYPPVFKPSVPPPETPRISPTADETGHSTPEYGNEYPISRGGFKMGSLLPPSLDPYASGAATRSAIKDAQSSSRIYGVLTDSVLMGGAHVYQRNLVNNSLGRKLGDNEAVLRILTKHGPPYSAATSEQLSAVVRNSSDMVAAATEKKVFGLKTFGAAIVVDAAINQMFFRDSVQTPRTTLLDAAVPAVIAMTPLRKIGMAATVAVVAASHFANRAYDNYLEH